MSDGTKKRSRRRRRLHLAAATAVLLATILAGIRAGDPEAAASEAIEAQLEAAAQTPQCVQATNWEHATAGRATAWLIFVWAKGSNTYIGLLWATTALQEGPSGAWTRVNQCAPPGPDGAAIYAANCAVCHGTQGEGGVGPSLQGVGGHGRDSIVQVVTNGRGQMPAWNGRLTPEEIDAVVDYVMTFEGEHHGNPTTTTTPGGTTTTTTGGTTTTVHGGHDH